MIDLHCHSTASDGTESPADVVWRAAAKGVTTVALTDHDTVGGWEEAAAALLPGTVLVPGMELSCRSAEGSLHLLAYLFDPDEPDLAAERDRIAGDRVHRAQAMVERLRDLGVPITWEQVAALADGAVGRPHLARALMDLGVVSSLEEAFGPAWLGREGRAYVARYGLDPVRAVQLVNAAGGVCVLAHSRRTGYIANDAMIEKLAAAGLGGLEVDHPGHTPADRARLRDLAQGLDLPVTGSSDDHGELTGHRLGCETTSRAAYEALIGQARWGNPLSGDD
jgi:3',5'-nucleoside bisphosphate phosphatase